MNKSNRGKTERWRCGERTRKSQRDRGEGERKREGESGGTAEVDTNEEPL